MKERVKIFFLLIIILSIFFVNSSWAQKIIVSGYALEKIVKEILLDQEIALLQASKIDFHSYEPTPSQWNSLKNAELVIIVGTEPWITKLLSLRKNKITLTLSQNKTHFKDPHLWFDWNAVESLIKTLIFYFKNKEPKKASLYENRATVFLNQIQKVKTDYQALKKCKEKRIYLLGHPVFHYLLKDFGIEEIAIFKGHIHEGEISLKTLSQIITQLKKNKIKIIYYTDPEFERFKNFFNSQGIEVLKVLSGDLPWEGDFISLLEKNLEKFKIGLQCE
ncbi:MAG: metal ABC transporter substrate-binding protein [Thermodesulfobacteriaceae bacterium]|nr:metal ABC transporter substrate-binding protein [Thermodesulfobacteriaceae bacterium]MCX8041632.1 metal ABC transporter substrate-binding protein [Thermodesulfobacteriaceae bacterium]MDW8136063.1 metal ABC transporter substrate-binding protein [Thermodesulfobacterium sp.]